MKTKNFRKKITLLLPIVALLVLSLLNMYGASFISVLYKSNLMKQSIWIIIGVAILFCVYHIDIKILLKFSGVFYYLGIATLALVLFFGKNVNGATSWFQIGPFTFQPSELFKFFYIIHLANVITKEKRGNLILLLRIVLLTFIPSILIFLEPDTGVVLMYLLMMFGLFLESGIKKRYIFELIVFAGILLGGFFYLYFFESEVFIDIFDTSFFYRIDRIISVGDTTMSYQLKNALIGIGASGPFGLGLLSSKIYIPEVTTDFVFDLTICNFGYIVGIIVVLLYTYILYRIYKEIGLTKNKTGRLILSSIFFMMFFQVAEHVLMNLGLTPITGITLPFLSYGGSSLISYFMLLGLLLKITTNNSSYN